MTSWQLLYRLLKGAFPDTLYHNERKMTSFEQKNGDIIIHFGEDQKDKSCHLLMGSDGARPIMHHQLLPQILSSYAEYELGEDLLMRKFLQKYWISFQINLTFPLERKLMFYAI
jgi:hypothetical protein